MLSYVGVKKWRRCQQHPTYPASPGRCQSRLTRRTLLTAERPTMPTLSSHFLSKCLTNAASTYQPSHKSESTGSWIFYASLGGRDKANFEVTSRTKRRNHPLAFISKVRINQELTTSYFPVLFRAKASDSPSVGSRKRAAQASGMGYPKAAARAFASDTYT